VIDQGKDEDYFKPERLRRQYNDYLGAKDAETREMREARHYYHGDQWTSDEIAKLRRRKQPVVTSNRIVRKIDAVVGLVERLDGRIPKPMRARRSMMKAPSLRRQRSASCSTTTTGNRSHPGLREPAASMASPALNTTLCPATRAIRRLKCTSLTVTGFSMTRGPSMRALPTRAISA
jgi:hypothetical protein